MAKNKREEFFIPKLGQTVEEVTLVKWLVADGEKVAQGQELCEVETDKAIFPVESPAKGYIHIGPFNEGDVLPVLTVIALIGSQDDKFAELHEIDSQESVVSEESSPETTSARANLPVSHTGTTVPASPRARKLAAEKGVDLSQVTPTGYEGIRIAERDVISYLTSSPAESRPAKATPVATRMAADTGIDLRKVAGTGPGGKSVKDGVIRAVQTPSMIQPSTSGLEAEILERIPLSGVRAIVSERMAVSVHTSARVTLVMEVDATEFVDARSRLKARVEQDWGFAPSYNDLLVKIVTTTLRQFPYMNARLTTDAIEILRPIHIGQAVDTERGLLVPVIRDADQKNLRQLGEEFRTLVDKVRKGRALPDELSGGTFTITNLGMYEVDAFTPVINLPEAAILGVGRIAPKVVPVDLEGDGDLVPAIRQIWTLSLVFDHRLVDGAPAARFLQAIKRLIEEPYLLLAG